MSSYQPFQCLVCLRRFTRHENLKRHSALHSRSRNDVSLPCDLCQATFSRPDLRHRHMKRKHAEHEHRRAIKRPRRDESFVRAIDSHSIQPEDLAVDSETETPMQHQRSHRHHAQSADLPRTTTRDKGDQTQLDTDTLTQLTSIVPDATGMEQTLRSILKPTDQLGPQSPAMTISQSPSLDIDLSGFDFGPDISPSPSKDDLTQPQTDRFPTAVQITRGCDLFFTNVAHFIPFLHQSTFDSTTLPSHLLLAMLSLAYQYGDDPECDALKGTGASLSTRCFLQARTVLPSTNAISTNPTDQLALIQTLLLLQICAMLYLCGDYSAQGLQMHSNMISLARSSGLMQPIPTESAQTSCLASLWEEFIKAESHKRTLFAVHQIDALWYQLLSIPRAISHLEVKHDLPCPESLWLASSAADWAHRRLLAPHPATNMQYADAVRHFLSSALTDPPTSIVPAFDPYGAINIAHFLISSAREISGWSTMTGMLSMERFSALRSSLVALGMFLHPQDTPRTTAITATAPATWETAMLELQIWSPSHTGGIIKSSIDTMLQQATDLAPSAGDILCEAETAKSFQSHVDWFLVYLDTTVDVAGEAPWVALYAYKAFLVAWQLVRGGVPGAMQAVGVRDGDAAGAVKWARRVFSRREKWGVGRVIGGCLDRLHC
ncbi:hypothetical protein BO94DRAFT_583392 [Aspergillus sclerotioniger CBS 115572]|uniref:C2H2-type domain-containing protein n=1 Tax=Aspergillus sclerotioniger CBS 115572 TaxID=1450535 RepID=A0A317X694_9EURO|nr:hypothetical protein BO94DRAFT_583392 [Aspergillus sclerotioniger CBS 115572]PWY93152.1 hypothetical protein BO94DRAFT_583392 [Aspergillus sclerotioniger CBS 115572]